MVSVQGNRVTYNRLLSTSSASCSCALSRRDSDPCGRYTLETGAQPHDCSFAVAGSNGSLSCSSGSVAAGSLGCSSDSATGYLGCNSDIAHSSSLSPACNSYYCTGLSLDLCNYCTYSGDLCCSTIHLRGGAGRFESNKGACSHCTSLRLYRIDLDSRSLCLCLGCSSRSFFYRFYHVDCHTARQPA